MGVKQAASEKRNEKGDVMKRIAIIATILGIIGIAACGNHKDTDQFPYAIPGITEPASADPAVNYTSPQDAVTMAGCDSCYTGCSGQFAVASTAFEFCNNDCVSDCMNGNRS